MYEYIVIFARDKFVEVLDDLVRDGLCLVHNWCLIVELEINPSTIYQEVKYQDTLESKLLWGKQTEHMTGRAIRALMICRRIAKSQVNA